MSNKPNRVEKHVYIPDTDFQRLLKYKVAKYNGMNAMNKVITDCIHEGIEVLEKRGQKHERD